MFKSQRTLRNVSFIFKVNKPCNVSELPQEILLYSTSSSNVIGYIDIFEEFDNYYMIDISFDYDYTSYGEIDMEDIIIKLSTILNVDVNEITLVNIDLEGLSIIC